MIIESLKPLEADINSIKIDSRNARKHPVNNLSAIKKSLGTFGQRKPIVANQNTGIIEAGNGLYMAAKELGWKTIACVFVDDNKENAMAYGLMDNQSALISEWDLPTLKDLLQELDTGEIDMAITGFTSGEIENLMTQFHTPEEGLTDDDAIPENVETICKKGDLWQLGNHRLLCGDSTVLTDVEKLMQGEKADMVFTDPPYGINIVKSNMVGADFGIAKKGKYKPITGDTAIKDITFLLKYAPKVLIWGGNYFASQLPVSGSWFIWDKRGDTGIKNTFADCELAWSNLGNPARVYKQLWNGMIREGEHDKRLHPTQKPVKLFTEILLDYSADITLDLFLGSGSTLIACEKLGRRCYGMEIDEHYCDVIINRWQDFTGKKAVKLNE